LEITNIIVIFVKELRKYNNMKEQHWNSKVIQLFGFWLWNQEEYGHAMLCLHGSYWGLKIGQQLKVTWDDLLHEDYSTKLELLIEDANEYPRVITPFIMDTLEQAVKVVDIKQWDDSIYLNKQTGKPLTTSTLNREFQGFAAKFLTELKETTGKTLNLKPFKTSALQIAWALDMLEKYQYSKKAFIFVSKAMGHKSVKHTIELLEVEPWDDIQPLYHLAENFNSMKDAEKLKDRSEMLMMVREQEGWNNRLDKDLGLVTLF
jgi:hypothetical protein